MRGKEKGQALKKGRLIIRNILSGGRWGGRKWKVRRGKKAYKKGQSISETHCGEERGGKKKMGGGGAQVFFNG